MYPGMGLGMGAGMMPMYPGMQVAFGMGQQQQQQRTPASTMPMGVYPAGTMPLSPLAQALCMLPTGGLGWCSRYGQPGQQQKPGQSEDQAGKWYPGYPGVPGGIQYPGAGGFPGGFPGAPGGGFPGAPGGGFPGAPGGGFPGAPGGGFPGAPGGGFPGAPGGGFPGAPGGGFPGGPPPQGPPPPSDNGDGVGVVGDNGSGGGVSRPDIQAVIAEEEEMGVAVPVETAPVEVDNRVCGKGKYFPIRYAANGSVAEEIERVNCYGDCSRIVNGADADQYEWPWIAALLNNGRQFCGGSLIDSKHILTAAHCVASMSRYEVSNLRIRLGEYKIKQTGETEIWESKAARVVRHKEFSQNTLHKDVAIITMEDEVPTSLKHVSPVCLPSGHEMFAGRTATVIGWGSLRENGPQPDTLQEMTVKIWDNAECKKTYGNAAPGGIMDHMLCAGKQGKDSCSGDSGGPMQIGTGDYWTQIGIVSWGIGCGKSFYPGVYTRVTEVRDWIDKITKEY